MMFSKKSMQQTRLLLGARSRLTNLPQPAFLASAFTARAFAQKDNFMSGANANYIDYMYSQWQSDPNSVHASWNAYFSGGSDSFMTPPTLGQQPGGNVDLSAVLAALKSSGVGGGVDSRSNDEHVRLNMLLGAFMTHGHYVADIDPLKLKEHYKDSPSLAQKFRFPDQKLLSLLDPHSYGFTEADMEREFSVNMPYNSAIAQRKTKWKLRELIQAYQDAYCGKIGVQFMHIQDREVKDWIRD